MHAINAHLNAIKIFNFKNECTNAIISVSIFLNKNKRLTLVWVLAAVTGPTVISDESTAQHSYLQEDKGSQGCMAPRCSTGHSCLLTARWSY